MTEHAEDIRSASLSPASLAVDLMRYYSFELNDYTVEEQVTDWQNTYPEHWLPSAIIEALYQGRYKAVSVEQILNLWQRRGQPIFHFNGEFERLVCSKIPRPKEETPTPTPPPAPPTPQPALSYRKMLLELPSVKAASNLERITEIPSLKQALEQSNLQASLADPTTVSPANSTNGAPPSDRPAAPTDATASTTPAAIAPVAPSPSLPPVPPTWAHQPPLQSPPPRRPGVFTDANPEFKEFKQGVVFALSAGLAAPALKPQFRLAFSRHYQPDLAGFLAPNSQISLFIPDITQPNFHNKLKSVVQIDSSQQPPTEG